MTIDLYCQRCIDYVDILLGVPPLGVYNHNIVGENGDFLPLHQKISRNSQTVSNAVTVTILTINCKFAVDFFAIRVFIHALLSRAYLCVS